MCQEWSRCKATAYPTVVMKGRQGLAEKHLYTLRNSTNGNETLLFIPNNTNSTIPDDDTTTFNRYRKNKTSKKGLTGGAIAAIVLACVAALVAVVAAIYCLNRPKPNVVTNTHEISSSINQMKV